MVSPRRLHSPPPTPVHLVRLQRRKVEQERQHQGRRAVREPPYPLVRHVPPRDAVAEASCRVHLRARVAGDDAARGEGDETEGATREEGRQAGAEEEALLGLNADAVGEEEVREGAEGLVEEDLARGGLAWVVVAATAVDTVR